MSRNLMGLFGVESENGLTRLVYTKDIRRRFAEWQRASPLPIKIVIAVTTPEDMTSVAAWLTSQGHTCWSVQTYTSPNPEFFGWGLAWFSSDWHERDQWYSALYDFQELEDTTGFAASLKHVDCLE